MNKWRAIGYSKKTEIKDGLIKTESPYKDLTNEENKIVDEILDYLEESYIDDYKSIMLHGNMDYSGASAEIDTVIKNYKDDGEEVPKRFKEAFDLFESLSNYAFLEAIEGKKEEKR